MNKKRKNKLIQFFMICTNITAIYCMMYHGLTDRFASTFKQILGYMLLIGILSLNTWLLIKKAKPSNESEAEVREL